MNMTKGACVFVFRVLIFVPATALTAISNLPAKVSIREKLQTGRINTLYTSAAVQANVTIASSTPKVAVNTFAYNLNSNINLPATVSIPESVQTGAVICTLNIPAKEQAYFTIASMIPKEAVNIFAYNPKYKTVYVLNNRDLKTYKSNTAYAIRFAQRSKGGQQAQTGNQDQTLIIQITRESMPSPCCCQEHVDKLLWIVPVCDFLQIIVLLVAVFFIILSLRTNTVRNGMKPGEDRPKERST